MLAPYVDDTSDRPARTGTPDDARRVRGRGRPARLAGGAARHRRSRRPDGARRVRAGGAATALAGDPHGRGVRRDPRRRHRVEHVETIDAADIPRFGRLGVVASMQPYHARSVAQPDRRVGGEHRPRAGGRAWSWRSIQAAGGVLAFGSDWPVVPYDPFIALNSAVNRQTVDGEPAGGWLPGERLSLPDALEAYTAGSAWAAFADQRRGRLAPGMDADLVVLDRDLLAAGPSAIIGTGVALTVLGGQHRPSLGGHGVKGLPHRTRRDHRDRVRGRCTYVLPAEFVELRGRRRRSS